MSIKTILFLPGWYPNKKHLSVGSFIRSHAEAINVRFNVDVLYVCGDEDVKGWYRFENADINGVDTYILYYWKPKSKSLLSQVVKALLYVYGQFYGYYQYRKFKPKPLFFHVHVLTRAAILPYVLKIFGRNINYFITEHWSRYLPQDNSYRGFLRKLMTKSVVNRSSGITAVSENLKFHMNRHGLHHRNFKVISNVTRDIFFSSRKRALVCTNHFVHVSNFAANCKNVAGILMAFKALQDQGYAFSLKMVGSGDDLELAKKIVEEYRLLNVTFSGFLYGEDVVEAMCEAKALVMFSHYENQPVVITESLSLGVPVIATTVGGIPEMVNENNGILVQARDVNAFAEAIAKIIRGEATFEPEQIRKEAALKYSSSVIAEQFIAFYKAGGVVL